MLKIEGVVLECKEKKFEKDVYYQLLVHNADVENEKDFELGSVNSAKPYVVGSKIYLRIVRTKDFKLALRPCYE